MAAKKRVMYRGAGRPPVNPKFKRNTCVVRLPQWLIERLNKMEGSRGAIVEEALLAAYEINVPKR